MNVTKKNIVEMVGVIKANYPYTYKDVDNNSMSLMVETWYSSLSKYDKRVVDLAFKMAIEKSKMPPTLADILEKIEKMTNVNERTDTELWEILAETVEKANDCAYYFNFGLIEDNGKTQGENARDRFDKLWEDLLPELKDYCGNKNGLLSLTDTDLSFEKGRFLRTIPTLRERQRIKQTTDPRVLRLVSELSNKFEITYGEKNGDESI